MALSASLFLRQNQSLVMTPQLMQSIQLLQMTHFELLQFIAQEVEKNPLLEMAAPDEGLGIAGDAERGASANGLEPAGVSSEEPGADLRADSLSSDWYETDTQATLGERLDANFDDASFSDDATASAATTTDAASLWKTQGSGAGEGGDGYNLEDFVAGRLSLRDHLARQLPFAVAPADLGLAHALVDQLDEAGYLRIDLDELCETLACRRADLDRVLDKLQTLEPAGVFARTLGECLAIQLRQRDRLDPAMTALLAHLDLLAKRDFPTLKRLCGVDEEDLLDMLAEIRALNPKPGAGFDLEATETVVPDVLVAPGADGGWQVELNAETLPRVLVNNSYFAEIKSAGFRQDGDQAFLSECLQNANWLTRSLDQRAKTILKVASEIIRQQDAFLRLGVDHLRPMNLKTVAEAIKMHESTVSRVTTNKYMLTPRGLFELKYFFSVSISSAEGGDSHSAEAVRHRIRSMIAQEKPDNILSDDDIVDTLKAGGVDLARRTVAKYREAMNIPSSVQRRREKRALAKTASQ